MIEKSKQEDEDGGLFFPKSTTSSTRQWSGFRNPRIVRVSRSFGGKDRHSKVCTIRGLRDRRIRLSVPTAIQLYDLQDRLGVGQPSKVIDWLLDVTKSDIDNLPPLQIPPGFTFGHHHNSNFMIPTQTQSPTQPPQSWKGKEVFENQNTTSNITPFCFNPYLSLSQYGTSTDLLLQNQPHHLFLCPPPQPMPTLYPYETADSRHLHLFTSSAAAYSSQSHNKPLFFNANQPNNTD